MTTRNGGSKKSSDGKVRGRTVNGTNAKTSKANVNGKVKATAVNGKTRQRAVNGQTRQNTRRR
jgi:hypothetical protein